MAKRQIASEVVSPTKVSTPARKPTSAHKHRHWGWRVVPLVLPLVLLIILAGLLPAILSNAAILNWVVARAASDLNGSVSIAGASLGWFSPVLLTEVEIRDAQGGPVARVGRVVGDKSLSALLLQRSRLGGFRLEQPQVKIVLRPGGSNVEDVLARYLAKEKTGAHTEVALEMVDGTVMIQDAASGHSWTIDKLQAAVQTPGDDVAPLKVHAAGELADGQQPGHIDVACELAGPAAAAASEPAPNRASIDADAVSAELLAPLVARVIPGARLAGRLTPKIRCAWTGSGASARLLIDGQISAEQFIAGAQALGSDQVRLERLDAVCQGEWSGGQAVIKRLTANCDLGEASMAGTFALGAALSPDSIAALRRQTFDLTGRFDLARLAQMLPHTLRIQQDTQIVSGKLQVMLGSRAGDQGMTWEGRLEAADLKATQGGRPLAWDQPVLVTFTASETPQGVVVDKLNCQSTFLSIEGSGTAENLTTTCHFDLGQLVGQLGQFVDFGGTQLAGEGSGSIEWRRQGTESYQSSLQFRLQNFRFVRPGQTPWVEPNLLVSLTAAGWTDFRTEARLDSAALHAESETDRLDVRLAAPVGYFADGGLWPVEVQCRGRLEAWPPRWRSLVAWDAWRPAGAFELNGKASISKERVTIEPTRLALSDFALQGPGLSLQEPAMEVGLAGTWDWPGRQLRLTQASVSSTGLNVNAANLHIALPAQGSTVVEGLVKYQGQLEHMLPLIPGAATPAEWHVSGEISGDGQFQQAGAVTAALFNAKIDNLTLTHARDQRQFCERQIALLAKGQYDSQTQMFEMQQFDIGSSIVAATLKGRVAAAPQQQGVDFSGNVQYDLDRLCGLLSPYVSAEVHFAGRGGSPAWLRGPMSLEAMQGEMTVDWAAGVVHGFRLGEGRLKLSMAHGQVGGEPVVLDVSEGKVRITPTLRLTTNPRELRIEPGLVAQQIRIDPVLCEKALKYGAPVLGGVATAEGRFSVQLDSCRIPLDDPRRMEAAGQMTVHTVQIEPGPLVRELALLLGHSGSANLKQESVIAFQVHDGRVYHQNLELQFPDLTLRTSGSVGLDHTLDLMAEMKVPPKSTGEGPLRAALSDQLVRLPVKGTLEKPAFDRQVLRDAGRQVITGAARNLLRETMSQGLDQLMGPKK